MDERARAELFASNRGIDTKVVREAEEHLEKLRAAGIVIEASYTIDSPFMTGKVFKEATLPCDNFVDAE